MFRGVTYSAHFSAAGQAGVTLHQKFGLLWICLGHLFKFPIQMQIIGFHIQIGE